jgi:hypothetical protein
MGMKKNYAEHLANLRMIAICLAQLEHSVTQGQRFLCMDVSAGALEILTKEEFWQYFDAATYEPSDWLQVISAAEQKAVEQMTTLSECLMDEPMDQLDMRVWLDTLAELVYLTEDVENLLMSACYLILKNIRVVPVDVANVFQSLLEETEASPELRYLFFAGVFGRYDVASNGCWVEKMMN